LTKVTTYVKLRYGQKTTQHTLTGGTTKVFKPTAKVIAESCTRNESEILTTFELKFHRFILPQFNKHRSFSSNTASSRAVPISRMIELVEESEVLPLSWGKNQPGMQATEELSPSDQELAASVWEAAKANAVLAASSLSALGVHKQVVNRLLEPFLPVTVIATGLSSAWNNFISQRLHPAAQPEMQMLAKAVVDALSASRPKFLEVGERHLPYYNKENDLSYPFADVVRACVARCARVSYLNHSGKPDMEADLALFYKLANARPPHLSPFEHVAVVAPEPQSCSGNFSGSRWLQLRHNPAYLSTLT
jgi:thymidylate synthase ThyX